MLIIRGRLMGVGSNVKITKHELLYLLHVNGPMTWPEISEQSSTGAYASSKRMQRYFQQNLVDKVGKKGQNLLWGISEHGMKRLNHFDQYGCLHAKCSLCDYDVEAYLEELEKAE